MRSILVVVGILGGVIPALSQSTPADTFGDTIVVTASLEDENRSALPATIDVIEEEEIVNRQTTAVLDLLATLPSMDVARSATALSPVGAPGAKVGEAGLGCWFLRPCTAVGAPASDSPSARGWKK